MTLCGCCNPQGDQYAVPSIYTCTPHLNLEANNCMVVNALHRTIIAERRTFDGTQGWVIEVSLPNAKCAMVAIPHTHTIAQLKAVVTEQGEAVQAGTSVADVRLRRNGQDL